MTDTDWRSEECELSVEEFDDGRSWCETNVEVELAEGWRMGAPDCVGAKS